VRASEGGGAGDIVGWALVRGAEISDGIRLGVDEEGVRGWIATRDLLPQEAIIMIPEDFSRLSASFVRQEEGLGLGPLLHEFEEEHAPVEGSPSSSSSLWSDDRALLSLYITAIRVLSRLPGVSLPRGCEEFAVYVASLPADSPDLPMFWGGDRTFLPLHVARAAAGMQEEFERAKHAVRGFLSFVASRRSGRECAMEKLASVKLDIIEEEYRRSWALVVSRSFRRGLSSTLDSVSFRSQYMLPLVDMFNHQSDTVDMQVKQQLREKVKMEVDGPATLMKVEGGRTGWFATRHVRAGAQVSWSYGDISSEELLLDYGFVPDKNLHGHSKFTLVVSSQSLVDKANEMSRGGSLSAESANVKFELVQQMLRSSHEILFSISAFSPSRSFMSVCRLVCIVTEEEMDALSSAVSPCEEDSPPTNFLIDFIGDDNEDRARKFGNELMQQYISKMPNRDSNLQDTRVAMIERLIEEATTIAELTMGRGEKMVQGTALEQKKVKKQEEQKGFHPTERKSKEKKKRQKKQ